MVGNWSINTLFGSNACFYRGMTSKSPLCPRVNDSTLSWPVLTSSDWSPRSCCFQGLYCCCDYQLLLLSTYLTSFVVSNHRCSWGSRGSSSVPTIDLRHFLSGSHKSLKFSPINVKIIPFTRNKEKPFVVFFFLNSKWNI